MWFILISLAVFPISTFALQQQQQPLSSNRVFIAGLKTKDPDILKAHLESKFGCVNDVFILKETSNPYAFVTFRNDLDAERSINNADNEPLYYSDIKPALASASNPRTKSAIRKQRSQQQDETNERLARESTVILQVQKSHLERISDFLISKSSYLDVEVVDWVETNSKSVALMGVKGTPSLVDNLQTLLRSLDFPLLGLNKVYVLQPELAVVGGDLTDCWAACEDLLQKTNDDDATYRLNVFPPKMLSDVLGHLPDSDDEITRKISPTTYSHELSILKLKPSGSNKEFFLIGSYKALQYSSANQGSLDDVSRAYHKLQEAFSRYDFNRVGNTVSQKKIATALDCGAAPGGWTKYLDEAFQCQTIYSIDPGDLSPSIAAKPNVVHLQMKIEEVFEKYAQRLGFIDIWVSDMCLHQMSSQIDTFLEARERGIVGSGTFFILTLKCNVGRSRKFFDAQAAEQAARLKDVTRNLQTLHLFANRSGERTLIGHLK